MASPRHSVPPRDVYENDPLRSAHAAWYLGDFGGGADVPAGGGRVDIAGTAFGVTEQRSGITNGVGRWSSTPTEFVFTPARPSDGYTIRGTVSIAAINETSGPIAIGDVDVYLNGNKVRDSFGGKLYVHNDPGGRNTGRSTAVFEIGNQSGTAAVRIDLGNEDAYQLVASTSLDVIYD